VEFVIFDQEGRELRRIFLPHTGRLSNGILFCFYQGLYFYLRENVEEEVWVLHSEKVWSLDFIRFIIRPPKDRSWKAGRCARIVI
jgi:hypothetical protein